MIWFGYYAAVVGLAYYFGRNNGLIGFGIFAVGVAVHQIVDNGLDALFFPVVLVVGGGITYLVGNRFGAAWAVAAFVASAIGACVVSAQLGLEVPGSICDYGPLAKDC